MKTLNLKFYALALFVGFALVSCKKEGCTDPLAINYDSNANHDDGLCVYDNSGGGGGGSSTITDNVTVPTTWSGNISVCATIDVQAALTIEPGTVISMCPGAGINVEATGSLSAVGTATSPISISGEVNSAGYWRGINFSSNNPNNQLAYVTIRDAGSYWAWDYANVYVNTQAQLGISNCTFSNSEEYGMSVSASGSITSFSNNTFSNNTKAGLNISATHVGSLDEFSDYNISNGENFINVEAATINSPQTWKKTSAPLLFNDNTSIEAAVTVNPGANIQFEASAGITIENSGSFDAVGTSSEPITMAGRFASAGYWRGISFRTNNPNNKLNYVNITDGGQYWANEYSGVHLNNNGRLEMNNTTITNSNSWGMYVNASCTVVCGGSTQTDAAGVLSFNTITSNGAGPDANCSGGGCTVFFN